MGVMTPKGWMVSSLLFLVAACSNGTSMGAPEGGTSAGGAGGAVDAAADGGAGGSGGGPGCGPQCPAGTYFCMNHVLYEYFCNDRNGECLPSMAIDYPPCDLPSDA